MTDFDKLLAQDLYVLVCEFNPRYKIWRPVVFESYLDRGSGSLYGVKDFQARLARLGGIYGKTRIAKLQFIDEGETNAG